MSVKPIPDGYHTLSVSLAVDDAAKAIDFYKEAFGAKERFRMPTPDGKIGHAELEVGDSLIMVADPFPMSNDTPPKQLGGTTATLFMYVEDVDTVVQQATAAGATIKSEVQDMFWGDRSGTVTDPFGQHWMIATHIEDVPPDQMEQRAKEAMAGMSAGS